MCVFERVPAGQMDPDGSPGITFPTGSHPPEATYTQKTLMLIRIGFPRLRNVCVSVGLCVSMCVSGHVTGAGGLVAIGK